MTAADNRKLLPQPPVVIENEEPPVTGESEPLVEPVSDEDHSLPIVPDASAVRRTGFYERFEIGSLVPLPLVAK